LGRRVPTLIRNKASFESAKAGHPKLTAWVARINSRPAVTRALVGVDDVRVKTTAFDNAGEGRGRVLWPRALRGVARQSRPGPPDAAAGRVLLRVQPPFSNPVLNPAEPLGLINQPALIVGGFYEFGDQGFPR
jgi:hypothetical protein